MLTDTHKVFLRDIFRNPEGPAHSIFQDFLFDTDEELYKILTNKIKLQKLEPLHQELLDFVVDYWIEVGLSTGPTDEAEAEEIIQKLYNKPII